MIRFSAARYALTEMTRHATIETWIVDDTGFLKNGNPFSASTLAQPATSRTAKLAPVSHSPQVMVTYLYYFELYIPESWANDAKRRKKARIPHKVNCRPNPQHPVTNYCPPLALRMALLGVSDLIAARNLHRCQMRVAAHASRP